MITCLNKAINLKGDEVAFYRQRGEAYIQLCDFQSAILNYKKACLLASNDTAAYQRLTFLFYFHGQCLFDQRLYPEALEAFSRAAEMNPDNVGYHIRRYWGAWGTVGSVGGWCELLCLFFFFFLPPCDSLVNTYIMVCYQYSSILSWEKL